MGRRRRPGLDLRFDTNLSLVISQTQEVHEQIADLLEQLRRLQDLQVTIEVRFITLNDNFFERIGVDFDFDIDDNTHLDELHRPVAGRRSAQHAGELALRRRQQELCHRLVGGRPDGRPGPVSSARAASARPRRSSAGSTPTRAANFGFAILSDIEAFFLIQAAQGDTRTNVLQAPKVTLFNGQQAFVSDTTQRPFVIERDPGRRRLRRRPAAGDRRAQRRHDADACRRWSRDDRRFVRLTLVPFFSQIGDVDEFTFNGTRHDRQRHDRSGPVERRPERRPTA